MISIMRSYWNTLNKKTNPPTTCFECQHYERARPQLCATRKTENNNNKNVQNQFTMKNVMRQVYQSFCLVPYPFFRSHSSLASVCILVVSLMGHSSGRCRWLNFFFGSSWKCGECWWPFVYTYLLSFKYLFNFPRHDVSGFAVVVVFLDVIVVDLHTV